MKLAIAAFAEAMNSSWSEERVRGELESLALRIEMPEEDVLYAVAMEVAGSFCRREIRHSDAMGKVSALYDAVVSDKKVPSLLHDVYWALDEAEYGIGDDDPIQQDTAEDRSRTQVKKVLTRSARNDA